MTVLPLGVLMLSDRKQRRLSGSSISSLVHPPAWLQAIQIDQRVTSKKKSKQREQEAAIQAAQRAAEADAAAGVTVRIYSVNETGGSVSLECSQMDLAGQRPTALHGGALLGVAIGKHIRSGVQVMMFPSVLFSVLCSCPTLGAPLASAACPASIICPQPPPPPPPLTHSQWVPAICSTPLRGHRPRRQEERPMQRFCKWLLQWPELGLVVAPFVPSSARKHILLPFLKTAGTHMTVGGC